MYASTGSLYAATTRWIASDASDDEDAWEEAWRNRSTSIHRFDISDASNARYEASGEVPGVIHNQFSLSEHAGHLRVVTTTGGPWGDDSESQVRVLRQDGDRLIEVGSVGDIGKGEQVQSVRFVGDIGYVVTFRQIDPFYTIDLSDPANPAIVGELKIPGFSSYLHPIGDGMVLGVGSDADSEGRVTGSKASLFDVSDLAAPREIAVWTAPDGWNDVGWDHRAFLWWAPESLAVIPVTVWADWSGAVVLRVADGTITEVGRVDHELEGEMTGQTDCREITAADLPADGAASVEDIEVRARVVPGRGLRRRARLQSRPGGHDRIRLPRRALVRRGSRALGLAVRRRVDRHLLARRAAQCHRAQPRHRRRVCGLSATRASSASTATRAKKCDCTPTTWPR